MGAPSGTNIPLARELNGVRLFVRTIKEPEYLGPVRLANALSKVRRAPSFLRILEEEVNMDFLSRNEELWVAVRSGLLSIPLPVADLAIVRLSEFHPPPMHASCAAARGPQHRDKACVTRVDSKPYRGPQAGGKLPHQMRLPQHV